MVPRNRWLSVLLVVAVASGASGQGFDPFQGRPGAERAPAEDVISSQVLENAAVTDVFRILADLTGMTIMTSPEVAKAPPTISLWIKDMKADEVLDHVTALARLVAHREGNVVKVMTYEEFTRLYGVEQRVIEIEHADAARIIEILKPLDDAKQSKLVADETGRKLVVLAPAPMVDSLMQLIRVLDVPLEKDVVEIVRLEHLEASDVVPTLEAFLDRHGAAPARAATGAPAIMPATDRAPWRVGFMIEPRLNVVVLRGAARQIERTRALIRSLDVPSQVKVVSFPLRYTNGADVYDTLSRIVLADRERQPAATTANERLKISVSEQNNRIIVEGAPRDLKYVTAVIEAIDQPLPAGTGGIRVYRLENASASEVAEVVRSVIEQRPRQPLARRRSRQDIHRVQDIMDPAAPAPTVETDGPAPAAAAPDAAEAAGDVLPAQVTEALEINAVIIRASAADHDEFAQLIDELDEPRDQVMLEVTLVVVSTSDGFDLGVELGGARIGSSAVSSIGFTSFGIGSVDPATGDIRIADPSPFGLNYGIFNSKDFSLVLNALKTVGETRITSAPKILVEDNSEAVISQVSEEPFEVLSQGETTDTTSFGGFVEAGTTLTARPHLTDDNWLRLEYQVNLSSFGARVSPTLPPTRQQNNIEGVVRVPSGHTVVLGGLVSARREQTVDGIPIVSDVPVVGELFKDRSDADRNDTLFVFIRPVVLRDPAFRDLLHLTEDDRRSVRLFEDEEPRNPLKLLGPSPRRKLESERETP
ncbi:MAG: hypothetical protein CMJ18_04590 [Phycisphaeraceae bacterium]|nr:hypothetical protein [Phycisphaeraceae bacterium]